ncbi:histidine kinase [Streptomyces sp. NPDC097619]|uniref:sensor histidine kinase n=1 Tax=Streptomyces sp. NPDC097619 TaxID=3157228 RepID=UPI00331C441E
MTPPRATAGFPLLRVPYDRWRACEASVKDGVPAVALALLALVPGLSHIGAQIGDLPQRPASLPGLLLVLAQSLPLVARRRRPAATVAVIAGAFAAHQALGFATTLAGLGLYLALYSAGAHQVRSRGGLAAALSAGYVVPAVVLHRLGSPQTVWDYLAFHLVLAAFWLVGSTVRKNRRQEAERRALSAEAAAAAERARIARELHDVVTHHVTAMVVQSDAAQFLLADAPERAGESLTHVSATGRRALTDLRHLLGVLEATGESAAGDGARAHRAPALGRVGDLIEQTRAAGLSVEFGELGERRPRSAECEPAAYRVVQEALTNALKHAAGQRTRVLVRYEEDHDEITVTTDGAADGTADGTAEGPTAGTTAGTSGRSAPVESDPAGGGRGLAGLGTRVGVLGGRLRAGPRAGGGFEVHAVIPCRPVREEPRE